MPEKTVIGIGWRVVSLRMPGILWGEEQSTVSARVVRVTDEGMALQFLDFDF